MVEDAVLGHLGRRVCHNHLATRNKSERRVQQYDLVETEVKLYEDRHTVHIISFGVKFSLKIGLFNEKPNVRNIRESQNSRRGPCSQKQFSVVIKEREG